MIAERIQAHPLQLVEPRAETFAREIPVRAIGDLRWVRPSVFRSQYELRSVDVCVATMCMRGLFRPSATGESADGCWAFEPVGPAPGTIVVRARNSYHDLAIFEMGLSNHGGILRFFDGRAIVLHSNFWKGRAQFQTLAGEPVLCYRFRGVLRPSADIEIVGKGKQMPELPWLLMLGWYLILGYL